MTAATPRTCRQHTSADVDFDAIVIGAGFSGVYALHRLRNILGLSVRVLEAGDGVGGTWYWNRYPGARCDSESYVYCFMFDKELWQQWEYSERYPEQDEIRSYIEHVAERYDLYRDIRFNTRVTGARFDERNSTWTVTTASGERLTARFVIAAVGTLSVPNTPQFPGLGAFRGEAYHTGRWPHRPVRFVGKRVAVIGTGASAIQAIPRIAQEASELTVFQRTANYTLPAAHGPVPEVIKQARKADYEGIKQRIRESATGFELYFLEKGASESTQEEVNAEMRVRYNQGGFGGWLGCYLDILVSDEANAKVRAFLEERIRERVNDPTTAELLVPKGYPFGVKRVPLESNYYETFNLPHVRLVDVKANPIATITDTGLRLSDGTDYEFDMIVFATGFDALTAPFTDIDFRGRGGVGLKEKWAEGPRTYLGLMTAGFPNLFLITGPQSPSVLSNMTVSIEQHVELVSRIISDMADRGAGTIEATREAEDAWVTHNQEVAEATLFTTAATWYMGANIPGKPRVFLPNLDFVGPYRAKCDEIVANGYEGFTFDATVTQEVVA
ncbi:NAD(P)/FAD-dependent oxidoreductase [Mycobacterium sp. SM1]|uniref:flavin-containing monooxygenase n=1 Tax=Mycobacterium sp. SM1 TaxID=2816243 RepID=UPI001BCBF45E|nr:NAD(P)/FAD-dependent oxidoreductase [Mycobacterium sp. SM1]MBS4727457.1 NAD(P)/FAD-dependent oxidoreductase [Mycobacterium sp. SM1]